MKLRHKIQLVAMLWFNFFHHGRPILCWEEESAICVLYLSVMNDHGDDFIFFKLQSFKHEFRGVAQSSSLSAPCVSGLGYHANQENQLQDTRPKQLGLLGQGRHEDPKR